MVHLNLAFLYNIQPRTFLYAENIERSFDKLSNLSFSYLQDYTRSTSNQKYEYDVLDKKNLKVDSTEKYQHVPGTLLKINLINSKIS